MHKIGIININLETPYLYEVKVKRKYEIKIKKDIKLIVKFLLFRENHFEMGSRFVFEKHFHIFVRTLVKGHIPVVSGH